MQQAITVIEMRKAAIYNQQAFANLQAKFSKEAMAGLLHLFSGTERGT
jgi:hypothetical protein